MKSPDQRGFTLIEVVVALAIVAIGMLAVFKTIGDSVNNVEALRDRSFAGWIADNRITEIRLSGQMPSVEETAGEVDFAGRHWHWVTKVSQTQVQGLRRVDVSVRRDGDPEDSSLVTLAGFVGETAMSAARTNIDWYALYGGGGPGGEDQDANQDEGGDAVVPEPEPVE